MPSSLARRARALARTAAWRAGARRALVGGRAAACSAAALLACAPRFTTGPADSATGRYALVRYQGLAIPADLGISGPYRGGQVGRACHDLMTGGTLTLDIAGGTFSYGYDVRDGCSQALVSQPSLAGLVTQRGADLAFRIPRFVGATPLDTVTFAGTWASGVVTIDPGGTEELVYR